MEVPVPLGTWGDGGLWSSVNDLVRAERMLWDDWRARRDASVLSRAQSCGDSYAPASQPYCYGVESIEVGADRWWFHGGGYAGYRALVARCLERQTALIVLGNCDEVDTSLEAWLRLLEG